MVCAERLILVHTFEIGFAFLWIAGTFIMSAMVPTTTEPNTMASKKKTCKALSFPAKTTDAAILKACALEWKKRNVNEDGTLKPNRWAPIYCLRGDTKLSVRLDGKHLVLFGELARTEAPTPRLVWDD